MCLDYYRRILYVIQTVGLQLLFALFRVESSEFELALSVESPGRNRGRLITSAGTDGMSRKEAAFVSSSGTEPSQAITCIREVVSSNIGWDNDYPT